MTITELHRSAMEYADLAFLAKQRGDKSEFIALSRKALDLEVSAINELPRVGTDIEPTRSVLCRSAAVLAMDCQQYREAERLIAFGLSGNPPDAIAEELRDLFEQVNFGRHLELNGVDLSLSEFQLSIAGKAVGFGYIPNGEFIDRAQVVRKMVQRTGERMSGKPFSDKKKAQNDSNWEVYLTTPRAASFAVSFRLGQNQMALPGMLDASMVVDELLTCVELLNGSDIEALQKRFQDDSYLTNFIGLARQIAPDGDNVNLIGFTAISDGEERKVEFTRPRKKILFDKKEENIDQQVVISGELKHANSIANKNRIKVVNEHGSAFTIIVPEGMMNDIVRPLWDEQVIVTGRKKRGLIHLTDITKIE